MTATRTKLYPSLQRRDKYKYFRKTWKKSCCLFPSRFFYNNARRLGHNIQQQQQRDVTLSGPNDIFRADLRDHQRDCYILDRAFVAFLVYIDTYLGENHIVHRFCLGRVGGSRSSDAPATGWVFVQLIVYSPYVNRTWSLIAFTIFLQVSSFRAAFIYQRGKSTTRKTYK